MCGLSLWWLILHISLLFSDSTIWKRSGVGGVSQYFVVIFTWNGEMISIWRIYHISQRSGSTTNQSFEQKQQQQQQLPKNGPRHPGWCSFSRSWTWQQLTFPHLHNPSLVQDGLKLWDFVVWQTLDLSLTWKFVTPPKTNMSPKNGLFQ